MKSYINKESQKFIKNHSNLINADNWDEFWSLAENKVYENSDFQYVIPKMREMFDVSGVTSLKNLDYIPNGYCYEDESITTFTIPEGIETIKSYAFSGCTKLKYVKLPSTLLNIEDGAFQYCESLEHIDLPLNVEQIYSIAFAHCKNLKRVNYPGTISDFSNIIFDDEVFDGCINLDHISCLDGTVELNEYGEPGL